MIAKELSAFRTKLEEVAEAESREKIITQLRARKSELEELRDSVLEATRSLDAIVKRTHRPTDFDSSRALQLVRKIRTTLADDPANLTKKQDLAGMTRSLNAFTNKTKGFTDLVWEEHKRKSQPQLDGKQLTLARLQKGLSELCSRLEAKVKYANNIGKKAPTSEQEFIEIETVWDEIAQMIANLPDIASDPNVQEFLRAANSRNGASIDLLTDDVRKYLLENNIAEKYRITNM